MIDLHVSISGLDSEFFVNLADFEKKSWPLIERKFQVLVDALKAKIQENLSGRVLQTKSGALLRDVVSGVERQGTLLIGYAGIEPENETIKEYALTHEYGGRGTYTIVPVNKSVLRFIGKSGDVVFTKFVRHPAAPERSYLRSALAEMQPEIVAGLEEAIVEALHGR